MHRSPQMQGLLAYEADKHTCAYLLIKDNRIMHLCYSSAAMRAPLLYALCIVTWQWNANLSPLKPMRLVQIMCEFHDANRMYAHWLYSWTRFIIVVIPCMKLNNDSIPFVTDTRTKERTKSVIHIESCVSIMSQWHGKRRFMFPRKLFFFHFTIEQVIKKSWNYIFRKWRNLASNEKLSVFVL